MACLASLDSMLNGNDNNLMNTTLELPDALASEIKRRAALEGRKLDDVIADMLRAGMAPATNAEAVIRLNTRELVAFSVRMTPNSASLQNELVRRHRTAVSVVAGFLVLDIALLAIAFLATDRIFRPGDQGKNAEFIMGLWIGVLVFGLGAFVIRRTKFAAMRLKDIAALKGLPGLLKTLQDTTIHMACIGGAIALMGFVITILTGDWTNMLRAAGVSAIVLVYCFPLRSAWERAVRQLGPYELSGEG